MESSMEVLKKLNHSYDQRYFTRCALKRKWERYFEKMMYPCVCAPSLRSVWLCDLMDCVTGLLCPWNSPPVQAAGARSLLQDLPKSGVNTRITRYEQILHHPDTRKNMKEKTLSIIYSVQKEILVNHLQNRYRIFILKLQNVMAVWRSLQLIHLRFVELHGLFSILSWYMTFQRKHLPLPEGQGKKFNFT